MKVIATGLEIPFSADPGGRAVAVGGGFQFLAAMNVRSDAAPASTVARTGPAFLLQGATPTRAKSRRFLD